jgi:hypothetical protein
MYLVAGDCEGPKVFTLSYRVALGIASRAFSCRRQSHRSFTDRSVALGVELFGIHRPRDRYDCGLPFAACSATARSGSHTNPHSKLRQSRDQRRSESGLARVTGRVGPQRLKELKSGIFLDFLRPRILKNAVSAHLNLGRAGFVQEPFPLKAGNEFAPNLDYLVVKSLWVSNQFAQSCHDRLTCSRLTKQSTG